VADFVIPELGENVVAGDVVRIMVKPGDQLKKDQPVLELETDKATIEVPSSVAGVVKEIKVKQGQKVKVGEVVLTVDETASAPAPAPAAAAPAPSASPAPSAPPAPASKVVDINRAPSRPPAPSAPQAAPASSAAAQVAAAPSTRRYARELGVDITTVDGSGPGGRVSVDDVKGQARSIIAGGGGGARISGAPLPDFSQWGEVEVQPLKTIRRITAERMAQTWATVPHVTQCDKADVTELERFREAYGKRVEKAGGKLTVTKKEEAPAAEA